MFVTGVSAKSHVGAQGNDGRGLGVRAKIHRTKQGTRVGWNGWISSETEGLRNAM